MHSLTVPQPLSIWRGILLPFACSPVSLKFGCQAAWCPALHGHQSAGTRASRAQPLARLTRPAGMEWMVVEAAHGGHGREWRAMRLEKERALRLLQRIARGVYATRTSIDWTRMSRGISERRWVQDRILLERTAHPVVQRRLRDSRMEWPIECSWPRRKVWTGMRHRPAEERIGDPEEIVPPSARRRGCLALWGFALATAKGVCQRTCQ